MVGGEGEEREEGVGTRGLDEGMKGGASEAALIL